MKPHKPNLRKIIKWLIVICASILAGFGIHVGVTQTPEGEVVIDISGTIELASEQKPATIETSEGEIEIDVPTVELVESKQTIDEAELDFGRGEYHDISSPEAYKNSVLGKCIDLDGKWGSQCVDGFADFNYQYTGRWLSTCGTGSARGLWDCAEYNAGTEYELITDPLAFILTGIFVAAYGICFVLHRIGTKQIRMMMKGFVFALALGEVLLNMAITGFYSLSRNLFYLIIKFMIGGNVCLFI